MSIELNCREDMSDVDKYWVLGVLGVAQECCSRSDQMDYTLLYSTLLNYTKLHSTLLNCTLPYSTLLYLTGYSNLLNTFLDYALYTGLP